MICDDYGELVLRTIVQRESPPTSGDLGSGVERISSPQSRCETTGGKERYCVRKTNHRIICCCAQYYYAIPPGVDTAADHHPYMHSPPTGPRVSARPLSRKRTPVYPLPPGGAGALAPRYRGVELFAHCLRRVLQPGAFILIEDNWNESKIPESRSHNRCTNKRSIVIN